MFVELPESGKPVTKGDGFGAVESVKATSDINSPISGEIIEVNTKLSEQPGLVISINSSNFHSFILPNINLVVNCYCCFSIFSLSKGNKTSFTQNLV